MYVAVKGGEKAIENAHRLLAHERRGDPAVPELSLAQISEQLALAVDRVMNEGSLYDRELAALAIKQARGDLIEAIFLLRAYPHHAAAVRRAASRSTPRAMDDAPAHLGDLQGSARRPGARADLRLHAPPARPRALPTAPMPSPVARAAPADARCRASPICWPATI